MSRMKWLPVLFLSLTTLLSGCQILMLGVVGVAAAVGLTGYVVYKTGEVAVTGVGKAAKATGNAISSGSKSVATVVYADGELKTEFPHDVRTTWSASGYALKKANFADVNGTYDALSGGMTARTQSNKTDVTLKLKSLGPQSTEMTIRVGAKGDLKMAELVHGLILRELPSATPPSTPATPQAAPASQKEVKE